MAKFLTVWAVAFVAMMLFASLIGALFAALAGVWGMAAACALAVVILAGIAFVAARSVARP